MSMPLQLRRESEADLAATTPAEAEPGYDQTNSRLVVGDGVQAGGIPHASYRDVQAQIFSYAPAVAVGDEYRIDLTPPLVAYRDGVTVTFKPIRNSEGPATLNINGLGALPLRKVVGSSFACTEALDLLAGQVFQATYIDGFFQLLNRDVPAQTSSFGQAIRFGAEYRLDLGPPLVSYRDGVTVTFAPVGDSQGPATLNVNSLGAVPVRKVVGINLVDTEAGDLQSDQVFQATFFNGAFQLLNR